MGYRVVMFLTCWIVLWIGVGAAVGSLFGTIGTGEVVGLHRRGPDDLPLAVDRARTHRQLDGRPEHASLTACRHDG